MTAPYRIGQTVIVTKAGSSREGKAGRVVKVNERTGSPTVMFGADGIRTYRASDVRPA